jgi:hypothetical protein
MKEPIWECLPANLGRAKAESSGDVALEDRPQLGDCGLGEASLTESGPKKRVAESTRARETRGLCLCGGHVWAAERTMDGKGAWSSSADGGWAGWEGS